MSEIDGSIAAAIDGLDEDTLVDILETLISDGEHPIAPYAPAVALTDAGLAVMEEELPLKTLNPSQPQVEEFAVSLANRIITGIRHVCFCRKMAEDFEGTVMIAVGDSWFQHPRHLRDVIDHLSRDSDKAILSFGAAGKFLSDIIDRAEFASALEEHTPRAFLISSGGNDLFGGRFQDCLLEFSPGLGPEDLVNQGAFENVLSQVKADYRRLVETVLAARPGIAVFGHGYDLPRIRENDGLWLGAPLAKRNIPRDIGEQIIDRMLDAFANFLQELETEIGAFTFINVRGAVGRTGNSWYDEVHPKSAGFGHIADRFRNVIEARLSDDTAATRESSDVRIEMLDLSAPAEHPDDSAVAVPLQMARPAVASPAHIAVSASTFSDRERMAREILSYEARRDDQGRIAVHYLRPDDGGGHYEVAGINERYHKATADELVALIEADRHDEAEALATEVIASYTDRADRWCTTLGVEFYLRDCVFNRGPSGAAWIVQHTVGVKTDRIVGPITRTAITKAEGDVPTLLRRLRAAREVYERFRRDESSAFWRGLENRWNKALEFAQELHAESAAIPVGATAATMAGAIRPTRVLNCLPSQMREDDWSFDDARSADILRASHLPGRWDLRAPWWSVGNQGESGSCVGWAVADSLMRWHFVRSGQIDEANPLSVRFIWMASKETDEFSHRPTSFIEDAGTSLKAALDVARKLGCVTDRDLPFASGSLAGGTENSFYARAARLKIRSYHNVGDNLSHWREWIYQQGPLIARVEVDLAFDQLDGTTARLTSFIGPSLGAHAVALVGYTPEGFILRNSWSAGWGDRGFALATDAYAQAAITEVYGITV